LLEQRAGRAEREPPRAENVEYELLVALVDPRAREPYGLRRRAGHARVMLGTSSRHCDQRSLLPLTVSRYAAWTARVTGPTPISWSSTERTGVTSAAVPHMKISSA